MSIVLGVDTGGTYTDAVLIRDESEVIASAKALTTRSDLAIGVGEAVIAVLRQAGIAPAEVSLAALSTTLATNALVEGQGGRVALIYVGFGTGDLDRDGLGAALGGDPVLTCGGGHRHDGSAAAPLDHDAIAAFLEHEGAGVSGVAVAARFATRNPAHEREIAGIVARHTGLPVTCSHELSARLGGPKRAVTAVLNARLIGMIDRLIGRTRDRLAELGIAAPMMVVRGDGALMSAEQARARPIETILSGPAASIVGARWLTGIRDGLVSDIGGTTTDVAVLRDGRPAIDPEGARVGGFRTMVEAVAMRTTGLGGDSQVHPGVEGLGGGVRLGPRRVVPVALIAHEAPDIVHAALEAQLRAPATGQHDAHFLRAVPGLPTDGLGSREAALLERIGPGVHPLGAVLFSRMERQALSRLVDRGLVQMAGVTPSDAAHVLGLMDSWDSEAARLALALMARQRTGSGERLAAGPKEMAQAIVDQLTDQTAEALLEVAFAEDQDDFGVPPEILARHVLTRRGTARHRGLVSLDTALSVDVVGLGASAPTWYPAVAERLRCRMLLPEHAGVANAIGAVVGRVRVRRSGTVTAPAEGRFRAHLDTGPEDFATLDLALARLESALNAAALAEVKAAGAVDIHSRAERAVRETQVEARAVFVEAEITVEASGRPRVALG